jgi:hypothetical protein
MYTVSKLVYVARLIVFEMNFEQTDIFLICSWTKQFGDFGSKVLLRIPRPKSFPIIMQIIPSCQCEALSFRALPISIWEKMCLCKQSNAFRHHPSTVVPAVLAINCAKRTGNIRGLLLVDAIYWSAEMRTEPPPAAASLSQRPHLARQRPIFVTDFPRPLELQ